MHASLLMYCLPKRPGQVTKRDPCGLPSSTFLTYPGHYGNIMFPNQSNVWRIAVRVVPHPHISSILPNALPSQYCSIYLSPPIAHDLSKFPGNIHKDARRVVRRMRETLPSKTREGGHTMVDALHTTNDNARATRYNFLNIVTLIPFMIYASTHPLGKVYPHFLTPR